LSAGRNRHAIAHANRNITDYFNHRALTVVQCNPLCWFIVRERFSIRDCGIVIDCDESNSALLITPAGKSLRSFVRNFLKLHVRFFARRASWLLNMFLFQRVDLEEAVARPHPVAGLHKDLGDLPFHLGFNVRGMPTSSPKGIRRYQS
jgi:hypothetical protein